MDAHNTPRCVTVARPRHNRAPRTGRLRFASLASATHRQSPTLSSPTPDPRSADSAADFTSVAKVGSIPDGQGITVVLGDRLVAIFNSDGEYFAIDDLCPHMGASLGAGEVYDGIVTCPWHAWRFKVADGTWCDNPRIKIDSFETRVVGDQIQVRPRP
jgi:nitrite reductase (NADH) small subunit